MKRRTIQVLGGIGIGCAVAGGWFALGRDYAIAIPLWIVAAAIILAQKRMRRGL